MNVLIIRTTGEEQHQEIPFSDINRAIGADCMDSFALRDGRRVWVDDAGHERGLPVNSKATALYHGICKPGTTWPIRGDVAIVVERKVP